MLRGILDNVGPSLSPNALTLLAESGRFSAHATHGDKFTQLDPAEIQKRRTTVTGIEQVQLAGDQVGEPTGRSFATAVARDPQPVIARQDFPEHFALINQLLSETDHLPASTIKAWQDAGPVQSTARSSTSCN